jgi:inorganic pyrophosphatase
MPSSRMIPLLSHLPSFDPKTGDLTVVIETPKGSPNKYDYDSRYGAFRFAAVLPEGMSFPFDFGFVPSTLGDDGDPLDVLVLLDASTPVGCILSARLLGVIKARQREGEGVWIQNDRLLAVATRIAVIRISQLCMTCVPNWLTRSRPSLRITIIWRARNSSLWIAADPMRHASS